MKIRYKIFLVILILLFIDSYGQKSNTYNHLTESEIEWLNQNKNSIKYAPNPFWPMNGLTRLASYLMRSVSSLRVE